MLALLLQGLTSSETWQTAVSHSDQRRRLGTALLGEARMQAGGQIRPAGGAMPGSDAKVLPVRFPGATYEQLKAWCEQQNFSMASVVRGLVERFLASEQLP